MVTHHDWRVVHRHDAGHGVYNPLWVDDDVRPEDVVLEVLHGAQIMEELHGLVDLQPQSIMGVTTDLIFL